MKVEDNINTSEDIVSVPPSVKSCEAAVKTVSPHPALVKWLKRGDEQAQPLAFSNQVTGG